LLAPTIKAVFTWVGLVNFSIRANDGEGRRHMLKSLTKRAFYKIAPETAAAVMAARARAHSHRLIANWGLTELNKTLLQELGNKVLTGPFQGLVLTPMTHKEHLGPYLLGTYESELHPWWSELVRQPFEQIVDVGSKFGYYAVGLARKFPETEVIAFDTDKWARAASQEMVEANAVINVGIQSFCSPAWLRSRLRQNALVVSDCEGYEYDLFCKEHIPALESATMLIEVHEHSTPGVTSELLERFSPTHSVSTVATRSEAPLPPVDLSFLDGEQIRQATNEIRSPQQWMLLVPNHG
jgi:precorrin-6B methylase 2